MGTDIRPELKKGNQYWIDRQRYYELKHFCLQYRTWLKKLKECDSMAKLSTDPVPPQDTGEHTDPTASCIILREQYKRKVDMLDDVAKETDPDLGLHVLFGIVVGIPYDIVKQKTKVPCCKEKYYELYRRFFWLLDQRRDKGLA